MRKYKEANRVYTEYRDSAAVIIGVTVCFFVLFCFVGYILSFDKGVALCVGVTATVIGINEFIISRRRTVMSEIEKQFAEVMQAVLSSVSSGMSIEQAFAEISEESLRDRRELKLVMKEVEIINRRVGMNYSFYGALDDFALRSGSADIVNLSKALAVTSERGGNTVYVIRNALANMRIKFETEKEIRQTLSQPKYNHRIMTAMPALIVVMLRAIAPDYINVMNTTPQGKAVIIISVIVVAVAWMLGDSFCNIKV